MKILCVDDERCVLETLRLGLRSLGYDAFTASDGHEALAIAEREGIRVFLLDLRMPKMNGMELCRRLREKDGGAAIYALSAYVAAYTAEQFNAVGFDGCLPKPFSLPELEAICRTALAKVTAARPQQPAATLDLEDVAWGSHVAQFYRTAQDLVDILVPYFTAGLQQRQLCMWITSAPLTETQATQALTATVPNLGEHLASGQIEIRSHTGWYLREGQFNSKTVTDALSQTMDRALAHGYNGVRAAGNLSWLEREQWQPFMAYEQEVNAVIAENPLAAICSYSLDQCAPADILQVASVHQASLVKRESTWQLIPKTERIPWSMDANRQEHLLQARTPILTATVKTVNADFLVVIGTDTSTGDYVAQIQSKAGEPEVPVGAQDMPQPIRAPTLVELLAKAEDELQRRGGEILNRGGLPEPEAVN